MGSRNPNTYSIRKVILVILGVQSSILFITKLYLKPNCLFLRPKEKHTYKYIRPKFYPHTNFPLSFLSHPALRVPPAAATSQPAPFCPLFPLCWFDYLVFLLKFYLKIMFLWFVLMLIMFRIFNLMI